METLDPQNASETKTRDSRDVSHTIRKMQDLGKTRPGGRERPREVAKVLKDEKGSSFKLCVEVGLRPTKELGKMDDEVLSQSVAHLWFPLWRGKHGSRYYGTPLPVFPPPRHCNGGSETSEMVQSIPNVRTQGFYALLLLASTAQLVLIAFDIQENAADATDSPLNAEDTVDVVCVPPLPFLFSRLFLRPVSQTIARQSNNGVIRGRGTYTMLDDVESSYFAPGAPWIALATQPRIQTTQVSRQWRDVALATPELWRGINFEFPITMDQPYDEPEKESTQWNPATTLVLAEAVVTAALWPLYACCSGSRVSDPEDGRGTVGAVKLAPFATKQDVVAGTRPDIHPPTFAIYQPLFSVLCLSGPPLRPTYPPPSRTSSSPTPPLSHPDYCRNTSASGDPGTRQRDVERARTKLTRSGRLPFAQSSIPRASTERCRAGPSLRERQGVLL
ncbi:hypothetical protein C8R45DRAFT_1160787 [Mycena sanguinolenta]|nr:hypothetical protein C8R45DRAFT_1160787 [Mycena sanguinolenta]